MEQAISARTVGPLMRTVGPRMRTVGGSLRTVFQVMRTVRTVAPPLFRRGWGRRNPTFGARSEMRPSELLAELSKRGVEVAVHGDRLRFRPQDAVTPELRAAL